MLWKSYHFYQGMFEKINRQEVLIKGLLSRQNTELLDSRLENEEGLYF